MNNMSDLNSPDPNLPEQRKPAIYGHETTNDAEGRCAAACAEGFRMLQANREGRLFDWPPQARETTCWIVINPGALTHRSVAIPGALNTYDPPVIGVRLRPVHKAQSFRHQPHLSLRFDGVIGGLDHEGQTADVRRICQIAARQPE